MLWVKSFSRSSSLLHEECIYSMMSQKWGPFFIFIFLKKQNIVMQMALINDEMIMDELFLPRDDSQGNYISSNCLFDLED